MEKGFMYLTAVIYVYSLYLLGWQLSNSPEAEIVYRRANINFNKNCAEGIFKYFNGHLERLSKYSGHQVN
jgi:hypothetical protein